MKGTIRENLGGSRYIVGIQVNAEPVTGLLADLNQQYADISQKLIQAQGELLTAQEPYDALLVQIEVASLSYQACADYFNLGQCVDTKIAICQADYSDCDDACYDIESGEGECDFECQKARDACKDRCQREREACLAQANVDCQEQYNQHVTECQKTWGPLISDLQQQALEMLPTIQEIMTRIAEAQAQQLSLARRINELDGVQSREEQVTCWRAQYDDGLAAGTEVEVARTPAGRTVITEIVAPDACLQDARGLPAKHVFVNSALYPGFETWRPTWRTGTVKAINEDDTLKVEIKGGTLVGSLGTLYSRNPIDCTPPQAYFDGNWQTAESRIKAARDALKVAQTALQDAAKVRDDCIAQYDQTWSNICYTDKAALCDSTWATWLAECEALEGIDPAECQAQYAASLAACYAQALAACADEKDALIAQCRADHQPAVDAAQVVVDDAAETLHLELTGIYQPASPLVLDVPVVHCSASRYAVNDDVLIDFSTRSGGTPMSVWDSARVIGWASETKRCQSYSIEYNTRAFAYSGYPVQIVYEGDDGTPITIFDVVSVYYGSCKIGQYTAGGSTIADLVFQGWSDGRTDNPRQETNVQDNIYAGAVGTGWPREIYLFIDITQNPETGERTEVWVWNAALQFYSATGIPDWFGTRHWFTIPWPEDLNAIGYSDDRPPIYIGKTEDLPGILPSTITVETVNLSAYGLSEKSKIYSRTGDFIYGNECSTAYPAYRYTRVD